MQVLNELDAYFAGRVPPSLQLPPVAIETLSRLVGQVPVELIDLLSWRDGESRSPYIFGSGWRLLRCLEIVERLSAIVGHPRSFQTVEASFELPEEWPDYWIPFITCNESVFGVLCARRCAVMGIDLQSGFVSQWASGLSDFFGETLRQLKSNGRLSLDYFMNH